MRRFWALFAASGPVDGVSLGGGRYALPMRGLTIEVPAIAPILRGRAVAADAEGREKPADLGERIPPRGRLTIWPPLLRFKGCAEWLET